MLERLRQVSFMEAALILSAIVVLWILWRVQRSPKSIDFVDLMIGPDGKASWSKMTGIGGYAVGTWIIIYLTIHNLMTEWYFVIYYAICVGSPVAFAIINSRNPAIAPPTSVNVTLPAGQTASVQTGPPST